MSHGTLVITGPTSGIGRATVEALAADFDEIVLLARNVVKAELLKKELRNGTPALKVSVVECNLASLASVEKAALHIQDNYDRIDCLINNAGVVSLSKQETTDGYELMMGTNYLGHYLLTHYVMPVLLNSSAPQIVIVSSNAYGFTTLKSDYFKGKGNPMQLYGRSKLATLYFMQELHEQFSPKGLRVTAVHPGAVATNLGKTQQNEKFGNLVYGTLKPFFLSPEEGAESTLIAVRDKEKYDGMYMHAGKEISLKPHGRSYYARKRLMGDTIYELYLDGFMER
ncbi:SDR family NAD(P)-dependent oxidoreductase [Salinicoccus carnicancri]|uniref:SDR family NAD(P)-dependent oxidoreductase n=1 Tax=Salinicoccus carnicancri TaxID=558170 RepID=UPI0002D32DCF|nr:SDR family NAD(P)-dependent oxidoreductase [Salinicoccus carnicancri]